MGKLRVIAGSAKGKYLQSVPGDTTRPITDRVKEALFDIIGSDIINASFLDLFAGTGSVGIEALSRGASYVRFIDNNSRAIQTIKKNLEIAGFNSDKIKLKPRVIKSDTFIYLDGSPDYRFDYIYVAPPQYKDLWLKALEKLDSHNNWTSDDGWIIAQIHPIEYKDVKFTRFYEIDQRKYGSTLLIFYEVYS